MGSEMGRKQGRGGLATGPHGCGDALMVPGLYLKAEIRLFEGGEFSIKAAQNGDLDERL